MTIRKYVVEFDYDQDYDPVETIMSATPARTVEPLSVWLETQSTSIEPDLHARCDETITHLGEERRRLVEAAIADNRRLLQLEAEKKRILDAVRNMLLDPEIGEWEDDHSFVQRMLAFGMPKLSNDVIIKVEYRGTLELRVENVDRNTDLDDLRHRARQALDCAVSIPGVFDDEPELINATSAIESFTLTTDS